MNRISIFIILCIAGVLGTSISMIFGLHWSCMIGTIIFIVAVALTLDVYFRERRERTEQEYNDLMKKELVLTQFKQEFNIDQHRAYQLYYAGFKSLEDFQDKTVDDLIQVEDINPTVAKRIILRVRDIEPS